MLLAGFCTIFATILYRIWDASLRTPLERRSDGYLATVYVRNTLEHGWWSSNPDLAAPFGAQFLDLPHGGEHAQFLSLKLLGALLGGDVGLTINVYYLLGFGLTAVAAHLVLRHQPWGLAYFNPLLGGGATGERSVLIGRGEGLELTDGIIRQASGDRCAEVSVARRQVESGGAHWTCGRAVRFDQAFEADFVVVYASDRQRFNPSVLADIAARGEPVGQVHLRGLLYAEVFDMRPGSRTPSNTVRVIRSVVRGGP